MGTCYKIVRDDNKTLFELGKAYFFNEDVVRYHMPSHADLIARLSSWVSRTSWESDDPSWIGALADRLIAWAPEGTPVRVVGDYDDEYFDLNLAYKTTGSLYTNFDPEKAERERLADLADELAWQSREPERQREYEKHLRTVDTDPLFRPTEEPCEAAKLFPDHAKKVKCAGACALLPAHLWDVSPGQHVAARGTVLCHAHAVVLAHGRFR